MKSNSSASLQVFTKLIRATETITSVVHTHLEEHDLTISQFGVLEALFHLGPMCQKEIASKILKSSGNLTMVITNLEKRGLVHRQRRESDKRYISVALTPEGRRLIEAVFPRHVEKVAEAMAILTDEEQRQLGDICRKFRYLVEPRPETDESLETCAVTRPTNVYQ